MLISTCLATHETRLYCRTINFYSILISLISCFKKQPEFASGSQVVKRRLAMEIVMTVKRLYGSRFLKKATPDGPWILVDTEKSIAKACQVRTSIQFSLDSLLPLSNP